MSLDQAIEHGKEKRKPYRGEKAIDQTCRNHGSCKVCEGNRKFKMRDKHPPDEEDLYMNCEDRVIETDMNFKRAIDCITESETQVEEIRCLLLSLQNQLRMEKNFIHENIDLIKSDVEDKYKKQKKQCD